MVCMVATERFLLICEVNGRESEQLQWSFFCFGFKMIRWFALPNSHCSNLVVSSSRRLLSKFFEIVNVIEWLC